MAKTWKTQLLYRIMDQEIERCARKYLSGRLIDIGCGVKPYESLLAPFVKEHVGLDREDPFNRAARVDLVGSADAIPAPDDSFDSALSTASLEHLPEPELALRECYRVLRPGGVALYTVPLFWHLHAEPWDYYRFTRYGCEYLFTKVGFEIVEITPLAGFWVTFATMFCYYIERFKFLRRKPLRKLRVLPAIGAVVQGAAALLERFDRAEEWTWMYSVVARKSESRPATSDALAPGSREPC